MSEKTVFKVFGFIVLISLGLTSCWEDKNKHIPDVTGINVDYKLLRFEQDLFSIDTNDIIADVAALQQKYPQFADFYFQRILQIKKPWDTTGVYLEHIKGFLTYSFTQQLYDTTQIVYNDLSSVSNQLKQGFQFYKYYFPEKEIPTIFTFISEFSYGVILPPIDNSIGIGLDLFLGASYKPYYLPPLSMPKYIAKNQDKDHLVAKVFDGLLSDMQGENRGGKFIDYIIHNGKRLYMLDQIMPYEPDSIKLGFTTAQTKWCEENELAMWAFFLKEELLYSNDQQKFRSLVSESPSSSGMPPESPGRAGNYMGWQIVKAYMQRFPETSLQDLLALDDATTLLSKARYKPRN